jgi:hypothetical protein
MPRALLSSLALIAASALAACGGSASSAGKFDGERKAVAEVVEDLQTAGERKDAGKICDDILARPLAQQIRAAGADCEAEMKKSLEDADDFELEVQSVTINGNRATARVKGEDGDRDRVETFEFVKERGGWRATALSSG